MILQCPACNARYAVPDHAIGANGRTVRCVKCAHEWFTPGVQAPADKLEELLTPPPKPVLRAVPKGSSVPKRVKPASSTGVNIAMAASMVLALFTTLLAQKPQWFGLGDMSHIVFTDLSLAKQEKERGAEFAISGNLINTSGLPSAPPTIRITLVDRVGDRMQFWEPVMPDRIEPRQPLPFTFGPLATKFTSGDRLVVELGSPLQLALRKKP